MKPIHSEPVELSARYTGLKAGVRFIGFLKGFL
jgi:hypothetical protein